jgi:hypothetical protein
MWVPHNLNRPLYKIRFFIFRFFFVASLRKIIYTKEAGRAVFEHERAPDHKSPSSRKGDLWLTLILAVRKNPTFTTFFTG